MKLALTLLFACTAIVCSYFFWPEKSRLPWTISPKVTLHKFTKNFVDLETVTDNVWVGCSNADPKHNVAFLNLYLIDGENSWFYFYRRPLSISQCRVEEAKYQKLVKGAKSIRVVGLHGLPAERGPDPQDPRIPERFTRVKWVKPATFVRLQANGLCKAYFDDDCDLPKNYWAGTYPD